MFAKQRLNFSFRMLVTFLEVEKQPLRDFGVSAMKICGATYTVVTAGRLKHESTWYTSGILLYCLCLEMI